MSLKSELLQLTQMLSAARLEVNNLGFEVQECIRPGDLKLKSAMLAALLENVINIYEAGVVLFGEEPEFLELFAQDVVDLFEKESFDKQIFAKDKKGNLKRKALHAFYEEHSPKFK